MISLRITIQIKTNKSPTYQDFINNPDKWGILLFYIARMQQEEVNS